MARKRPTINVDQSIAEHPRIIRISPELQLAAIGLHVAAIGWCDRMRTDGVVPASIVAKLVAVLPRKTQTALLAEITRVELWEATEDGYAIHDYLDWQDSAEQIAARSAKARESVSRRTDRSTERSSERCTKRTTDSSTERCTARAFRAEPNLTEPTSAESALDARAQQDFERLAKTYADRGDPRWPEQAVDDFLAVLEAGIPADDLVYAAEHTPQGHKQTLRFWLHDGSFRRYLPKHNAGPCPDDDCINGWLLDPITLAASPCPICNKAAEDRLTRR